MIPHGLFPHKQRRNVLRTCGKQTEEQACPSSQMTRLCHPNDVASGNLSPLDDEPTGYQQLIDMIHIIRLQVPRGLSIRHVSRGRVYGARVRFRAVVALSLIHI